MRESDFQERVTNVIINQQTNKLTAGVTDNELAVVIEVGEYDAAYTAEEARSLAYSIEMSSAQRDWDVDTDPIVGYIRSLADVVDGIKTAEDVEDLWNDEKLKQS